MNIAVHPYAARFPMLPADELQALADDIAQNGQLHPILLWINPDTGEEQLIDGRNRLAACELAGVAPKTEHYEGNPYALIVSANTQRRNLNAGQVAMARAIALIEQGKRKDGKWEYGSKSANGGTSTRTQLQQAGFILDHDPPAADLVFSGETLAKVYAMVQNTVEARKEKKRRADILAKNAPNLSAGENHGRRRTRRTRQPRRRRN
jgi:hypothetical protein